MPAPATRARFARFAPVLLLGAGLALFFAFGLQRYVSLAALKANRALLQDYVAAHPFGAAALFGAIYVAAVACSIPAASALTLAGGFLFGVAEGTVLVVLSATLGASAIFLATKTALAGMLRARMGPALQKMEDGFHANAFNYVLVLRLIPIFPFFLVNIGAGLIGIPFRTYVLATLIGIIPGTLVYVGLGNGLGKLFDQGVEPRLGLIFEPAILLPILGLAFLALVPVLWRMLRRS